MGKAKKVGIIIIGLFGLVAAISFISGVSEAKDLNKVNTKSFAPQETTVVIVNGVVDVAAGGFIIYPLIVPNGANAQLSGSYTPYDGDIRVLLFDKWKFDMWKEKRMTTNLGGVYEGYIDSGKIQMPGDGRTWIGGVNPIILVFDNTNDPNNNKRIDANITLRYTEYN